MSNTFNAEDFQYPMRKGRVGMKQDGVKVVIAAQQAIIRVGMQRLLGAAPDIQILGEASNGQEAFFMVEQIDPDVLILELEMPVMDGIQTMEQLKQSGSKVPIIMISLSLENDPDIASEVIQRGAWGFYSRQEIPGKIVEAVRQAGRGNSLLAFEA
jgi:DNA-binding NarL/FixJ family response regulator